MGAPNIVSDVIALHCSFIVVAVYPLPLPRTVPQRASVKPCLTRFGVPVVELGEFCTFTVCPGVNDYRAPILFVD